MKCSFRILTTLCLLAMSSAAFAAPVNHTGKISRIYPAANALIKVQLKDISTCSLVHSNHYFTLNPSLNANFDEYYALILAAAHAGDTLIIRGDDAACSDGSVNETPIQYVLQDF